MLYMDASLHSQAQAPDRVKSGYQSSGGRQIEAKKAPVLPSISNVHGFWRPGIIFKFLTTGLCVCEGLEMIVAIP